MAVIYNMDTQSCITNLQWERYSNKTLSEPEMLLLKEHAGACEICADMKEGIDAMKAPEMLKVRVDDLNTYADNFISKKKNKIAILWYWSAAAIIVLAFGISWFVFNKSEIIAVNEQKDKTINQPVLPTPEEKTEIRTDTRTSDIIKPKAEKVIESPTNQSVDDAVPVMSEDKNSSSEKALKLSTKDSESQDESASNGQTNPSKMDSITPAVVTNQAPQLAEYDYFESLSKDKEKKSKEYESTKKSPTNEVVIAKTSNKKRKAENVRETYPSANNNANNKANTDIQNSNVPAINLNAIDSVDFSLAKINYDSTNYDKCIVNLYYITINPNSKYYEDGLLLKAKTLIKQNKKEDAKVALNTVIMLNRGKQKEASELLNQLK